MKAALVTGAARRVGARIATRLAETGWHVVLHHASSGTDAGRLAARIEADGGRASTVAADLRRDGEAARLVAETLDRAPGLELVVNNASTFAYDTAATVSAGGMMDSFAVNAVAPVMIAQHFAASLPPGRQGAVINILDNRVFAPNPDYFSYGVSKHALLGATRMLALALAPAVRVNGIAPGITLVSGDQTEAAFEAAHRMNPLRRGCTPDDIADAVVFIAGSGGMTGEVITIDGGLSLANPGRDVAFIEPAPQQDEP